MEIGMAKKVVIITETMLKDRVLGVLCALGAKGYTVYHDLSGKGRHGVRSAIEAVDKVYGNTCIEVIVAKEELAISIMEEIYHKVLANRYAGIVYLEEIRVVCPEKF
jgi:hypothetical protein